MSDKDIEVPARYYVRLGQLLASRGVDVQQLFAKARVSARAAEQPDAHLRLSQVERLVALAAEAGGTDIAVDLGRTLSASTHSIVGFGMLNSPNVERAMQFVTRFFRLVMPSFSMRYTKLPNGADISWVPTVGMSAHCLTFHLEGIAAAAYTEVTELSRELPPFRGTLSIPEPRHRERYLELKGAQWQFGVGAKPTVHLIFDYDLSRYPLGLADSNALRVAEERCRSLASSVAADGHYKDWAIMMLREAGDGQPSLSDLAAVLNLSPRTLDRYLRRENTGFRKLAAQVQYELACARLARRNMSVTEVAHSLGFSDTANFTRSFKSLAGCGPREYRLRILQSAAESPEVEPVPE